MPKVTRDQVYAAIDSERAYQEHRWNPEITGIPREQPIAAFIAYTEDYLARARTAISDGDEHGALNMLRKVAALAVVNMEQHGAYPREGFEGQK